VVHNSMGLNKDWASQYYGSKSDFLCTCHKEDALAIAYMYRHVGLLRFVPCRLIFVFDGIQIVELTPWAVIDYALKVWRQKCKLVER
jgi:hypothetical protein